MRIRCSDTIRVAAPLEETFPLFTASGERRWVPGWDPAFPMPTDDETQPGTVFVTAHGDAVTNWVVTAAEPPTTISYSRCTPGEAAGTVTIICTSGVDSTEVEVSYDLTALTPAAEPALQTFAHQFRSFLDRWQTMIDAEVRP
jgi:Polyketide cyclase / dehydrase and lipid transport